jgi:hypothetical protein
VHHSQTTHDAAEHAKPRRRWRSFSLRTLFIVLTVATLTSWAALAALDERRMVRRWIDQGGGVLLYFDPQEGRDWREAATRLSWIETTLGEKPVRFVGMPCDASDADERRLRRVFPEMRAIGRCPPRSHD